MSTLYSKSNPNLTWCPYPRQGLSSHLSHGIANLPVKIACGSRSCPYLGCRLMAYKTAHASMNKKFNGLDPIYYLRINAPVVDNVILSKGMLSKWLAKTSRFARENGHEFVYTLYPEKNKTSQVHWQGPAYFSDTVVLAKLREFYKEDIGGKRNNFTCAIEHPEDPKYIEEGNVYGGKEAIIRYCIKDMRKKETLIIHKRGHKLVLSSKKRRRKKEC